MGDAKRGTVKIRRSEQSNRDASSSSSDERRAKRRRRQSVTGIHGLRSVCPQSGFTSGFHLKRPPRIALDGSLLACSSPSLSARTHHRPHLPPAGAHSASERECVRAGQRAPLCVCVMCVSCSVGRGGHHRGRVLAIKNPIPNQNGLGWTRCFSRAARDSVSILSDG